ncbi:thyroid receptor-interacting protein 11-like [Clarias magur]|uniref:Thyroid receptor-interacting protein 11-like n=1 Tax=Clarias magur TaxID=1594786 RepID=A0A8J4U272_CLAMG|nr:thyroid receptor-interacting protein 11-like [Clarias magur]
MCDVDGVRQTGSSVTKDFHANLAEAQRKYEEAMKTTAQLQKENSELSSYVNLLEDTVKDQEKELCDSVENCSLMINELKQEQEAHSILKSTCEEMRETLTHNEESLTNLQVSLGESEEKYENLMKIIVRLEDNISDLKLDIEFFEDIGYDFGDMLTEAQKKCSMIQKELKQEQDTHRILKSECKMKAETFKQCEAPKVLLSETKSKHKQVVESNAQLEKENAKLMIDNEVLQDCVHELEEQYLEDLEEVEEAYRFLQSKYEEALKQHDESLKVPLYEDVEKTQENAVPSASVDSERSKLEKKVMELEELLHVKQTEFEIKTEELQTSLAKAQRKHKKVMQANACLKKEISDLKFQVAKLQDSVEQQKDKLSEAYMHFNVVMKELEEEKKVHSITESQYLELMNTPTQSEQTLRVALAEAETKYEQVKQSNDQLVKENTKLLSDNEVLQDCIHMLNEKHGHRCIENTVETLQQL